MSTKTGLASRFTPLCPGDTGRENKLDNHPIGLFVYGGCGEGQARRCELCPQTMCKALKLGRYLDNKAWYILLPRRVEQRDEIGQVLEDKCNTFSICSYIPISYLPQLVCLHLQFHQVILCEAYKVLCEAY